MVDRVKKIGFDCDGVLADYTGYLLKKLDCGLMIDDCFDFSFRKVLKKLRGDDVARKAVSIVSKPSFTATLPVLPWAHKIVDLAHDIGDLTIATSPWASEGWYDARVRWLYDNFKIHVDNVMVGRNKFLLNFDIFVDDKPKNIIEWCEAFPTGKAILLAWPYNKDHPELPSNAVRMEPDELIEFLEKERG